MTDKAVQRYKDLKSPSLFWNNNELFVKRGNKALRMSSGAPVEIDADAEVKSYEPDDIALAEHYKSKRQSDK